MRRLANNLPSCFGGTLLRTLIQRIIERYINCHSDYSDNPGVVRVKIIKLDIDLTT